MICPNCKAEIPENSKFCTKCGTKIEVAVAPEPVTEEAPKCIKCGAELKMGAKFCTKCGTNQELAAAPKAEPKPVEQPKPADTPAFAPVKENKEDNDMPMSKLMDNTKNTIAQNVAPKTVEAPKPAEAPKTIEAPKPAEAPKPVEMPTPVQKPETAPVPTKNGNGVLIAVCALLAVLVIGGGVFVAMKFVDIKGLVEKEKPGQTPVVAESSSEVQESETEKVAQPELLNEVDGVFEEAKAMSDAGSYEDAIRKALDAVDQYRNIGKENGLTMEATAKINPVFAFITSTAITYCDGIKAQELGSAGYNQIKNTLEPIVKMADGLAEDDIYVEYATLRNYNEGVADSFKKMYIKKINEITEREQWSRDEAWAYAEEAYSIQENGQTVLFAEDDLDDPLRMRYAYCLAWISQKRCEKGVADGSMSNEDAYNAMVAILEETDYNLLVLQDIINYGSAAGYPIYTYNNAYNAIMNYIRSEQNLSIVNSGVNSGTTVDLRHFWYFNDLDGSDEYMVDIHNGTTQATREWIRNNIPDYLD